FYFFAFINGFAAVTALFKHPDLLSAPAGSRGGGLKPQSGPARQQAVPLNRIEVLIRRLCYLLAQKGDPDA
ncbi:hypothetical protein, partial [Salmonella enterica]|uniref:hypothetical protein n=1 Tax=Salmonella enterica TaxID=28901 RepID=UPI001130F92C